MLIDVEARALIGGETVVAFVDRHALTEGEEFEIEASSTAEPSDVKPAYRRWAGQPLPVGDWVAVVVAVHPAALLDPESGSSRHVMMEPGGGDLVILRVYGPNGQPVLSETAFTARVGSIEGALNR